MNRITKWIQERKAYSNPTFGTMLMLMLILSAMTLPVFQASARVAEPVQPMTLNGDQVADALGAVSAGVSVDQAFGVQPVPYRDWVSFQSTIFESLFQSSYTLIDSDYFLFSEVSLVDERAVVQGHNAYGELFDLELIVLTQIENVHDDISDDVANYLAEFNANDFAFTGTIRTDNASVHISGVIFQADLPDGSRSGFLLIGSTVDQSIIDFLNDPARDAPLPMLDGPEPQDCEQAFAIANNNYNAAVIAANAAYDGCMKTAARRLRNGIIICTVLAVGAGAGSFGIGALLAAAGGFACASVAAIDHDTGVFSCSNAYDAAMTAAMAARTAARQNALAVFGVENCGGGPF